MLNILIHMVARTWVKFKFRRLLSHCCIPVCLHINVERISLKQAGALCCVVHIYSGIVAACCKHGCKINVNNTGNL